MRKLIFAILLLVGFCNYVFADTLYLENGNTVKGKLVKEDPKQVVFMVGGEDGIEVTFFKDEIIRIDKTNLSSMFNMTMDGNKEISVPLPDLSNRKPIITEQAGIQIEGQSKVESDSDITGALAGTKQMSEELISLLNKEELEYFMKFTDITKESATRISTDVMNLGADTATQEKQGQLIGLIDNSSTEMDKVIAELEKLTPPIVFENFHNKYLDNLRLLKEIFSKMKTEDMAAAQEDVKLVQQNNEELRQEFQKILDLKRLTKTEE